MAYEAKELVEKLKKVGLDVAEDGARGAVEAVFEWLEENAAESESQVDDLIVGLLPPVKKYILDEIDKIDGEEG